MAKPAAGLIGLGTMGGAFARHLIEAGYTVSGYDVDAKRRRLLEQHGGTPRASVAAVARENAVVITSLPSISHAVSGTVGTRVHPSTPT